MEDEWKGIKTAMQTMDCDMSRVRSWQKSYEKAKKQLPAVKNSYQSARHAAIQAKRDMKMLEKMMIETKEWTREAVKEFQSVIKELKRMQNNFDHEFLVSRADRELHSTYDTILKLGMKVGKNAEDNIILHSEIENALELLKENLGKREPDLFALSFFYINGSDQELIDLPPAERLNKIENNYRDAFWEPMKNQLIEVIGKADKLKDSMELESSRRVQRLAKEIGILWNREGERLTAEERADRFMKQLCQE